MTISENTPPAGGRPVEKEAKREGNRSDVSRARVEERRKGRKAQKRVRGAPKRKSKANFSEVLQKFEEYGSPRQNVVSERYKFFSCVQLEGQTIETYVTQLKTLVSTCEFAEQENGLIRDRIVLEIKDSGLQERLLRENNLNIEKAIEIIRAAEASQEQIQNMKYDTAATNFAKENQNKPKTQYNYKKCGRKHKPLECPALGKICAKCKKKNYFAAKCF
ncbi:uncharacterized protein TNCV_2085201 [Trichonephila clavipes]|uniref:Retrotransposon gag domain-containing protein n=1 Tax=Trichonephila clavipes TaxID=2585209 RepID=A0A8X6RT06_TRICX|nr:uncharacterized protein TNCV_2085201 [Trichonephila clavipes]